MSISCIIPCYNLGRYLHTAVLSATNQVRPFDEIIVIDDGSTDETVEVMNELPTWIECLSTKNRGYAKTRNLGARIARSELYVFLDADDWLFSDYVTGVTSEFHHDATVGVVCPQVEAEGVTVAGGVWPAPMNDSVERLMESNYVWAASAVRARAFHDVGGFLPSMEPAADWALWVKLRLAGWHIRGVHKVLWHWRDRPDGLHMLIDDQAIRERIRKEFSGLVKSQPTP